MAPDVRGNLVNHDPALEAVETELLLEGVYRHYGYDFRNYDVALLERRIREAMGTEGLQTITGLEDRLLHDPACFERFLLGLAPGEAPLFEAPSWYWALRSKVIPLLRTYPSVRVWLAGCSTGLEAYALAIVLIEQGLGNRFRIYATDQSSLALERARLGRYALPAADRSELNYLAAGGSASLAGYGRIDEGSLVFDPAIRENIVFATHNLVTDGPFNQFHLIVCPQVLTFYNPILQLRVLQLFKASLLRLGFLCFGRDVAVSSPPSRQSFQVIDPVEKIYRRVR